MFNFPYFLSTCSLRVPAPEIGLPYGRIADIIIIVRVPVLCVTAELGLEVPVREYQQLQYGSPYFRHSHNNKKLIRR